MRFSGDWDTVECDDCGRIIPHYDDMGSEEYPLCPGCSARACQAFEKKPCSLCGKPLGNVYVCWNTEDDDCVAHTKCVEKLPESKQEVWCDDWSP